MESNEKQVPIWEKSTLTIYEAAAYTNIGQGKLRELTRQKNCPFAIWIGTKCLLKRKQLEDFLDEVYSI